ncbi:MAG: hypothetical protein HOV80_29225, partial [Polyangiaceae bacterium]|nr:hypothetical protein [Polyangiaceae bacterium]
MSDTATEASPPSRANTRELRLRVQSGFSAGEIRRLLEAWGAAPEELEGDVGTLAHHLVRIGDKRFGVPEMARRFRAEKPLLEWPEEDWGSDKWAGKGPGIDVETTIVDVPVPPEKTVIEAVPEEAAPPAEEPESIKAPESVKAPPPPSTKNPMIFLEPEAMRAKPARQGIDPKWLAIGGGALVVVVGLAFVAGLAWRRDDAAPEAAPQAKPDGPTLMGARAAGFLDQSLLSVAALCELDVDGAPTREVLIVAQESCGPQKPGPSRRRPELGDEPAPRPDEPTRVRPRAAPEPEPKRNDNPAPAPAAGGGKGSCTKSCMRVQDECLGACGDEPKDAKLYDAFQQCTSK